MMGLMEGFFDLAYLGVVLFLGIRLLFEKERGARRFGIMAIVLGAGDAFHLVPRVVSNLTPNGFERYVFALSWGQFVTSITMTLFYILFYLYYVERTGDRDKKKGMLILGLAALRLVLVLLPQNGWGTEGDFTMGIVRNIPFTIMGLLLILWTYRARQTPGLRYVASSIAFSFLFYLIVVLGASTMPLLGLFMIPKTVAYVLLIAEGYNFYLAERGASHLLKLSGAFLVLGLAAGVFYREFTKFFGFTGKTTLSLSHTHLLVLGFILMLLFALLWRNAVAMEKTRRPFILYLTGLTWTVAAFMVRGIYTITAEGQTLINDAALSGMAGLGHILLGVGLVWLMVRVSRTSLAMLDGQVHKVV